MSKTTEQVLELDDDAIKAIAKQVTAPEIDYDKIAEKMAEKSQKEDKEVNKLANGKEAEEGEIVGKFDNLDKFEFAAKQFQAWVAGDRDTLKELNEVAVKSYSNATVNKATYLNAGTAADGGNIVPNNDLMAEVWSLLDQHSEAANDIRVITLTEGDGLDLATLVTDVIMTEVGTEGGTKPVTKPVLGTASLTVKEFAGIAILTKKLVRQAAINIFDLLAESFARAIATKRAELVLTDPTGLANVAGVVEVETAGAIPTWAEIASLPFQASAKTRAGAKYYISGAALAAVAAQVDTTGRNLDLVELDATGLGGRFKNGYRFAVEAGLGEGNDTHVVFGNLGRYGILLRQGIVENETFDTGTVVDGSAVVHNLLQQNKLAQRVAFYENAGFPLPAAFVRTVNAVV